jgi:phasin family protein
MENLSSAISAYLDFCKRNVPENVVGGAALSDKIFAYAEKNVASAFEFASRLAQVRDVQELAKLQMDFIQAQMQAMSEQSKNLSETTTKAITDALKSRQRAACRPDCHEPAVLLQKRPWTSPLGLPKQYNNCGVQQVEPLFFR